MNKINNIVKNLQYYNAHKNLVRFLNALLLILTGLRKVFCVLKSEPKKAQKVHIISCELCLGWECMERKKYRQAWAV